MRDLECHGPMVKGIEKGKPWTHLPVGNHEDRFEAAFEDAALRLLGSLRNAIESTGNGIILGSRNQGVPRECPQKRLISSGKYSRRSFASCNIESKPMERKHDVATLVNVKFEHVNRQEHDLKLEAEGPSASQLLRHPLALVSYVPKDVALFFAGAVAGATAKTVTAPLDRIKLLMQVHGVKAAEGNARKGIGFLEATSQIAKEEGLQGYWKGNFPQVIRVIPYSAVQLLAYEVYKKLFKGTNKELSVVGRLAAGACAGMTSTLVTYPLDVLRLRLAVDPACKSMSQVASSMLREEGLSSFYRGLGPSLLGIAPYIALNFCAFDLIKKSLPEDFRKKPAASFATALMSATLATAMCYPLDTVRRQLQMKGTPYLSVLDAIPGIINKDGLIGLYRGFVPNALKNLPNSSIRLTTFDAAKNLISSGQQEFQRLLQLRREQIAKTQL